MGDKGGGRDQGKGVFQELSDSSACAEVVAVAMGNRGAFETCCRDKARGSCGWTACGGEERLDDYLVSDLHRWVGMGSKVLLALKLHFCKLGRL